MIIGTPKEVKKNETRVAMTPSWAEKLVRRGHRVLVQKEAGVLSGFSDEAYVKAGAEIAASIEEVYKQADFITKVKELQSAEYDMLQDGQMVMTWFHLAEDYDRPMTEALLKAGTTALSMELIVLDDGSRPTMKPMSDIAGSLAMLESVKYCQTMNGGTGLLLRKVYGLTAPRVVVLGGGNAGFNAAQVAIGLGLDVTIVEASWKRIDWLKTALPQAQVIIYDKDRIGEALRTCDLFINCIYPSPEPGKREPLVTREQVRNMEKCSLIMDIAGAEIVETSRYTTLENPTYKDEGILHYCVPNMPSLCPRTSTEALLMITGPYIGAIADKGLKQAACEDKAIMRCISTVKGKIVHREIGINQDMPYVELDMTMLD